MSVDRPAVTMGVMTVTEARDSCTDTDASADTSDTTAQRRQWSSATLIAFRFGICYFGSFGVALAIGLIPVILAGIGIDGPWSAMGGPIHVMHPAIEWIGTHLLRGKRQRGRE